MVCCERDLGYLELSQSSKSTDYDNFEHAITCIHGIHTVLIGIIIRFYWTLKYIRK
jgi:hypothetical protein